MPGLRTDSVPLSGGQLRATAASAARQLTWGQPQASRIMRGWHDRADRIPDASLRAAALTALRTKRGHSDGAALFSVLGRRDRGLLDALIAFELIWDYLDTAHEAAPDERNGTQLHRALVDSIDAGPSGDYYRHHPWRDDGGYLAALVGTCRDAARALPSYPLALPLLRVHAARGPVLARNHLVDAAERDAALRRWAAAQVGESAELAWFELSGAASASLVPHVLLACAADPASSERDLSQAADAYWPWICLATTMLDSYVDQAEDAANGNHSYIGHYATPEIAVARVEDAIRRSAESALALPDGHRHAVIVACMVAMYLSKDSAWTPELRPTTLRLVHAGGSLTRLLLPVLRLWRIRYRHRSC